MKTIHALLIGINAYPTAPLGGCINDALAVDAFFQNGCLQLEYRWRACHMFAPREQDLPEIESAGITSWEIPTRANIIAAFSSFFGPEVAPGDVCLIFFGGHGSQEPAAPEFRHLKSDAQNETLVCVDSRQPGGRDLVDKEMAWLLWRITEEHPAAEVLVLMDCCHSGDNTRAVAESVLERRIEARNTGTPFQKLLGIQDLTDENAHLFSLNEGRAEYRAEGRYVQFAAARDQETAKEMRIGGKSRGVFTWSLLRVLEEGGLGLSCREALRRVEALVRLRVQGQIPQLHASPPFLANQQMFGGALGMLVLEYSVFLKNGVWQMRAGQLQGIVPGTPETPVLVTLVNGSRSLLTALHVGPSLTVLDASAFASTDRYEDNLRAVVRQMPVPKVQISLLPGTPVFDQALRAAWDRQTQHYTAFNTHFPEIADYFVRVDDGHFLLLQPSGHVPVFNRQSQADDFVRACEKVGKWRFALELHHAHSSLRRNDIEVVLEIIEGCVVSPQTLNILQGRTVIDPDTVELHYTHRNNQWLAPALRCTVRMQKSGYWVGGLFLDSQFGIADYLEPRPLEPGQAHQFCFPFQNTLFNAIPLSLDARLAAQGITEIVDYLKIFVSDTDFKLDDWRQEPLSLDEGQTRSPALETERISSRPDWMAITIPVKVIRQ